jgi:hypothetical protein
MITQGDVMYDDEPDFTDHHHIENGGYWHEHPGSVVFNEDGELIHDHKTEKPYYLDRM